MRILRTIAMLTLGLTVSACATVETATRNVPLDATRTVAPLSLSVNEVRVSVPRSLRVSEANRYYPGGDIVWREDPAGDRHEQVRKIFEAAMVKGARGLDGGHRVDLDIEVTRFHALTEKARYTIGGVHALQFKMQLRDPETGRKLGDPRLVKADLKAFGGAKAIAAERAGQTQKVRITNHLAGVIRKELNDPGSHRAAGLGLIGVINQI